MLNELSQGSLVTEYVYSMKLHTARVSVNHKMPKEGYTSHVVGDVSYTWPRALERVSYNDQRNPLYRYNDQKPKIVLSQENLSKPRCSWQNQSCGLD